MKLIIKGKNFTPLERLETTPCSSNKVRLPLKIVPVRFSAKGRFAFNRKIPSKFLTGFTLRPYRKSDAKSLQKI